MGKSDSALGCRETLSKLTVEQGGLGLRDLPGELVLQQMTALVFIKQIAPAFRQSIWVGYQGHHCVLEECRTQAIPAPDWHD